MRGVCDSLTHRCGSWWLLDSRMRGADDFLWTNSIADSPILNATRIVVYQQITWTHVLKMLTTSKSGLVGQCCSFTQFSQLAPGLKRTSLPSLLRKWKIYLFLQEKRTLEISVKICKSWNEHFPWLLLPFPGNPMAKVNIFSFSGIFKIFQFCRQFPKNIKTFGQKLKKNFKPFSSTWASSRKGPCSNRVYTYVCMNRCMNECMNVKQKQLCNATKLFFIFVCFANLY